jgi:hypothetical protein
MLSQTRVRTIEDVNPRATERVAALRRDIAGAETELYVAAGVFVAALLPAFVLGWWGLATIPLVVFAGWRFSKKRKVASKLARLERWYLAAGEPARGIEFEEEGHVYAADLHLFGEGSMFEALCSARTGIGRRGLAEYLLRPTHYEECLRRQEAVLELRDLIGLRERIVCLGSFENFESRWETFAEWLEMPVIEFPWWLRWLALGTVALLFVALGLGVFQVFPWPIIGQWVVPVLALQATIGMQFRERLEKVQSWLGLVSIETEVLREGLELLAGERFQSAKLQGLCAQVQGSPTAIRSLSRWLEVLSERGKDWFYLPSLLLMLGSQSVMHIEMWRREHGEAMKSWLAAWGEFEALHSIARYAYENPEDPMPELVNGEVVIDGKGMGHPLIALDECVRNDIRLDAETRFYVISGSNMAGKSTFLRTIGLNALLAYAGAPVRAERLRISVMSVCASLSVVDSLLHGKSKFMAEMERLKQTIEKGRNGESVLFLIDEIMSGTNSRDRRVAAEAVVRGLLLHGAIGALSTHDLALAEIASEELHGVNVHMCSKGEGDPLDFDYTLKAGVSTEANALAIARMAGIEA